MTAQKVLKWYTQDYFSYIRAIQVTTMTRIFLYSPFACNDSYLWLISFQLFSIYVLFYFQTYENLIACRTCLSATRHIFV